MITVYGKPNCVQCKFTLKELDRLKLPYSYQDVTVNAQAMEHLKVLGFQQVPVVVTKDNAWSGFKPDSINSLKGIA